MFKFHKLIQSQYHKLDSCLSIISKSSGQRTLYAPSYFGVDKFEKHSAFISRKESHDKASLQQSIRKSMGDNQAKIFTDDLKKLLYLSNSKADFELCVDAVKKYTEQDDTQVFDFNFGPPLLRCAYVLNETDKMLELFMDDDKNIFKSNMSICSQIVMNKLFEAKRYDDVVKVFLKNFERSLEFAKSNNKEVMFPYVSFQQVIEALLEKNDSDALNQLKEINKLLKEHGIDRANKFHYYGMFLLATQQGDYEYAYEMWSNSTKDGQEKTPFDRNVNVIGLLNLNKIPEAVKECEDILYSTDSQFRKKFFASTIALLKESSNKVDDELQQKCDAISSVTLDMIVDTDPKQYWFRMQTTSPADKRRMKEQNIGSFGDDSFRTQRQNFSNNNPGNSVFSRPRRPSVLE